MNYKVKSPILLALLLAISFSGFSRNAESYSDKRRLKQADNLYTYADYEAALPIYLEVLRKYPDNWKINYRIGICYYYSTTARPRSVPYFAKAVQASTKDTMPDLLFHAGLAYLCVNDFENAEKNFLAFKRKAGTKYRDPKLNQLIAGCASGRTFWSNPNKARISNLGPQVNSPYPDYAPVVIYKSDILLFTSKRPGNTGNDKDDEGFYYEDIYQAKGESWNRWKEPTRYDTSNVKRRGIFSLLFNKAEVVSEINTEDHDGSITLSPDSTDLYVFRYGDIMKAKWDGTRWERPARIGEEIDARASHEPSIFLSRDGKSMFFVSDRKGGVGQKDIWICEKEGSDWGKPRNLGMEVNTSFNEDSPFLSPDGMTLYFSSEGHNSMGGYDVFRCTRQPNGMWSQPENLGAPINNGGDDIFYTPLENGSGAYYSTLNRAGEGDLDLHFIQYFPAMQPMAKLRVNAKGLAPKDKVTVRLSTPEGKELHVFGLGTADSIMYAYAPGTTVHYEVSAPGFTTITSALSYPNTTQEEFVLQQMTITREARTASVELENYAFAIDKVIDPMQVNDPFTELPKMRSNYLDSLGQIEALTTTYTTNSTRESAMSMVSGNTFGNAGEEFESIYFDFDRSELSSEAMRTVQAILAWMNANPESSIEITGHADEKGNAVYNQRLSEKRAIAVKNALVKSGISAQRIITSGKGEAEPIVDDAPQDSSDPGRHNRRVVIRVAE